MSNSDIDLVEQIAGKLLLMLFTVIVTLVCLTFGFTFALLKMAFSVFRACVIYSRDVMQDLVERRKNHDSGRQPSHTKAAC